MQKVLFLLFKESVENYKLGIENSKRILDIGLFVFKR